MAEHKKVPCRKCGGEAVMDKWCGDNGSNANGVMWRLECSKCGHHEGEWIKSQMFAIGLWESKNRITEDATKTLNDTTAVLADHGIDVSTNNTDKIE
jgi:hypothetical protein